MNNSPPTEILHPFGPFRPYIVWEKTPVSIPLYGVEKLGVGVSFAELLRDVEECVAEVAGIKTDDLRSASRKHKLSALRHLAWALARYIPPTPASFVIINRCTGRDHTSVMYGVNRICTAAARGRLPAITERVIQHLRGRGIVVSTPIIRMIERGEELRKRDRARG